VTTGGTTGVTTGGTTGVTTGATTGITTGGTTGVTTGGSTGVTTGGSTGNTTGATTGNNTGGATNGTTTGGNTTGGSTGSTTGGSTGSTTGSTTGGSTGSTTGGSTGSTTGGSTGSTSGGTNGPMPPPPTTCSDGSEPFAAGVKINEIALYQAVKIPLVKAGAWTAPASRNSPVVQNKRALVRIFLTGAGSAKLRGVVTLDNGTVTHRNSSDVTISGASTDSALASTLNITLEPGDIGPNTKLAFSIYDPACPANKGTAANARFPASGMQDLTATKINKLKVVVVPIIVNGLTPNTSAAQLENMRKDIVANYPIPDAVLTVRPGGAVTSQTQVGTQAGWSQVLSEACNVRRQDNPPADVYYYGLITPAASFSAYCQGGCVLGIANLPSRPSPTAQCGIGVGWLATAGGREDHTATTFTHEEGHNHSRKHVACNGEAGTDTAYPYNDKKGSIGSWGWDSRTNTLKDPAATKDYMSYCGPTWTSDYTYKAVGSWSTMVNVTPAPQLPAEHTWHGMLVQSDGSSTWAYDSEYAPGGDYEPADVIDEDGVVIDTIEVVHNALDHSDDYFLFTPPQEAGWAGLILKDGKKIDFTEVAPARQLLPAGN
jgi:hypothetical protein